MSQKFNKPLDLSLVKPGEIVEIGDGVALNQFESDFVALKLPPQYSDTLLRWQNRPKLSDVLRPPNFNGTLKGIVVVLLDNPYEQMIAKWASTRQKDMHWGRNHTFGFAVAGDMKSTGRGTVSHFESRIWVYQRRLLDRYRHFKLPARLHFGEYNRKIELSKEKDDSIESTIAESKKIGEQVLRFAIRHPYRTAYETSRKH